MGMKYYSKVTLWYIKPAYKLNVSNGHYLLL